MSRFVYYTITGGGAVPEVTHNTATQFYQYMNGAMAKQLTILVTYGDGSSEQELLEDISDELLFPW